MEPARVWRKTFIITALIGMLLAAVLAPLAELQKRDKTPAGLNKLLFFPAAFPSGNWQPADLQFRDIGFNSADGTALHAWFCPADIAVDTAADAANTANATTRPPRVALYLHGNAANITLRAEFYRSMQSKAGVSLLAVDYRGFGKSEGVPSVDGVLADARAALAKLCQLTDTQPSSVVVIGESLGGAIAAELAAEFHFIAATDQAKDNTAGAGVKALVLVNSFSSLRELAELHHPRYAALVPTQLLNTAARLSRFGGPVLICQSEKDQVVPIQHAEQLFAQANEPKAFFVIPATDHDNPWTAGCLNRLSQFFNQLDNNR